MTPQARAAVLAAVLAAVMALGGCTLVDQNTFYPHAGDVPQPPKAPVVAAAPKPAGPPPLVTIAPGAAPAEFAAPLHKAVQEARARKPDVVFDVVEMEPPDAPPETVLGRAAADVARAIVADGVVPARVRLAARPDAAAVPKEVRVYVR